jgi:hypothetical protein
MLNEAVWSLCNDEACFLKTVLKPYKVRERTKKKKRTMTMSLYDNYDLENEGGDELENVDRHINKFLPIPDNCLITFLKI